ncbi:MAG: hypothetical protein Q7T86_12815 [Hyphomicrobiaceae bacterium]|nr:hypothetical protein [Hyphomicrobiaceae bacterium]
MSGALRAVVALAVVGTAVYSGFIHRSPWIIALLSLSFTVLYIAGKLAQWRMLARSEGAAGVAKAVAVTWPVQAIMAGVFYLIGLGIGAIFAKRDLAGAIEPFDLTLAGGLLVFGIAASAIIHTVEARAADQVPAHKLSADIREIMDEAHDLSQQAVAMPVQIFALSRRLTDHPDRREALVAMEQFFGDGNAFVRRVAYTALRFMGQAGRDLDPQVLDRHVVKGMGDAAVWVRYDAAWIAGIVKGDDAAYANALRKMIEDAVAAQANRADKSDAEHKALTRARESLKLVEERLG